MTRMPVIALVMMTLILSLPIVHAQELSIIRLSGKAGVNGFAKTQDELTIEVNAKLPQEDIIDNEQVRLFVEDSFFFFDNCTKVSNSTNFKCVLRDPEFSSYEPINFGVKLFNDDEKEVLARQQTLSIDAIPPVIINFTVGPRVTKGDVKVWYNIEEYGLEYGLLQGCSGVREVRITQLDKTLVNDVGKQGECHKEKELSFNLNQSGKLCMVLTHFSLH